MGSILCEHCAAACCRYLALPIDKPTTKRDYDDIRWYLMHEGVSVFVEESDQRTIIRVRDTGIGVNPEHLPRIFEKFSRSGDEETQKRSGHGLGLPLAKEIVELHGGSIRAESVVGEGSEFAIVLRKRSSEERSGT